jgi:hypothetical protein
VLLAGAAQARLNLDRLASCPQSTAAMYADHCFVSSRQAIISIPLYLQAVYGLW